MNPQLVSLPRGATAMPNACTLQLVALLHSVVSSLPRAQTRSFPAPLGLAEANPYGIVPLNAPPSPNGT